MPKLAPALPFSPARVEMLEASLADTSVRIHETTASLPQLQAAVDALGARVKSLGDELASLEAGPAVPGPQTPASGLKMAYVDLTGLMNEMFQQELREKLQPLQGQLDELKSAAEQGHLNTFIGLYQQLSTPLQQLDQLVSQVIQAMLADITQEVAQGYALVLRKENALYLDQNQLADLTPQVKAQVPELFSP